MRDKIKRGLLASCFFAFFCPFAATAAMPFTEMTAQITGVDYDPSTGDGIISLAFMDHNPLDVVIDSMTEVDPGILVPDTVVKIEAIDTEEGLLALEISSDDSAYPVYELKGIITGKCPSPSGSESDCNGNRTIELFGVDVPVGDVEIKDIAGKPILFDDLNGSVKVEGVVVEDNFVASEIQEIHPIECTGSSTQIFRAYKPADLTHKTTERYCQLDSGKTAGRTLISFTDYTGQDVSSYTVGKYLRGDKDGYWLSIDVTGNVIRQCLYKRGNLVDGDESCPQ